MTRRRYNIHLLVCLIGSLYCIFSFFWSALEAVSNDNSFEWSNYLWLSVAVIFWVSGVIVSGSTIEKPGRSLAYADYEDEEPPSRKGMHKTIDGKPVLDAEKAMKKIAEDRIARARKKAVLKNR